MIMQFGGHSRENLGRLPCKDIAEFRDALLLEIKRVVKKLENKKCNKRAKNEKNSSFVFGINNAFTFGLY